MLFHFSIFVQTHFSPPYKKFISSFLLTKKIDNDYYLCIKNSIYPNGKTYNMAMLRNINYDFLKLLKMELEFKGPKEILFIQSKDKKMLYILFRQLKNIIDGKDFKTGIDQMPEIVPDDKNDGVMNNFDLDTNEFIGIHYFQKHAINTKCLSKLVLEDCNLSLIPEELGHLPIKYFSISGNNLPTSQYEQDIFWNWTSKKTICDTLKTLKMDTVGLRLLPFEILYLKNLRTLSACNNKLVFIPLFIEELKNLKNLFVANNSLSYFPLLLTMKSLAQVNVSNNLFHIQDPIINDHLISYIKQLDLTDIEPHIKVKKLSHIVFLSLMNNFPRLKRQDLPRSLWMNFYMVGRCLECRKLTLPEYASIFHMFSPEAVKRFTKDRKAKIIELQTMYCISKKTCDC